MTTAEERTSELEDVKHLRIPGPEAICMCLKPWPCLTRRLITQVGRLTVRVDQFTAECEGLEKERDAAVGPIPTSYACQECGRRDGLDAAVTDEVWEQLTGRTGGGLLCLWCMDKLAVEKGITAAVMLHFNGRALVGVDGPTIWDEDGLTEQLLEVQTRCVRLVAQLADARGLLSEYAADYHQRRHPDVNEIADCNAAICRKYTASLGTTPDA